MDITERDVRIGACVTFARLIAALAGFERGKEPKAGAGAAANPAIRQIATVGGNLLA